MRLLVGEISNLEAPCVFSTTPFHSGNGLLLRLSVSLVQQLGLDRSILKSLEVTILIVEAAGDHSKASWMLCQLTLV